MTRLNSRSEAPTGESAAAPSSWAFVVRLWKEARAEPQDEPVWRGTVVDLHGRRLGSFSSAAELAGLIGAQPEADVLLHFSIGPAPQRGERAAAAGV